MQSHSHGGPPARPPLGIFDPDAAPLSAPTAPPVLPDSGPTLRQGARARIENLRLAMEAGASKDAFSNLKVGLTRFCNAWYVVLDDNREFLIPETEPRRVPLKISAANEDEAVVQAWKLAEEKGDAHCQSPVIRNGERPISECSSDDMTRWLLVNPQWTSGHTKRNNLVGIVECFHWFEEERDVKSPYKRKRIPKFVRKSRREATDKEYVTLMRHGCRELRRVLWTHYNLVGIRPGEVRGMLWSDFDWDGGFVLTFEHKTSRITNKPRLFAFTPRQFRFFRNLYKQRKEGSDFVFLNTKGTPWTRRAVGLNLRHVAERSGLDEGVVQKVSAGCFRQTFATQSDEAGLNEQDTAMLMGHKGTAMLREVYSKASRKVKHVRGATEKAERLRREQRKVSNPSRLAKPTSDDVQGELF